MTKLTSEEKRKLNSILQIHNAFSCIYCSRTYYSIFEDDILEISDHKFVYTICPHCKRSTLYDLQYVKGEIEISSFIKPKS